MSLSGLVCGDEDAGDDEGAEEWAASAFVDATNHSQGMDSRVVVERGLGRGKPIFLWYFCIRGPRLPP